MKTLILLTTLLLSSQVSAESCWKIYQAEADKINKEDGYTEHVGGQIYIHQGSLGYWPGIKVAADIDNWAEDFVHAIKWGPMIMFSSKPDPRLDTLKKLYKDIKHLCPLQNEDEKYQTFRAMLTELMEDGSFCPENKMLERPILNRLKHFRKIVKDAVVKGQFQAQCQGLAVMDDSSREVKDTRSPAIEVNSSSKANEQ